MSKKLDKIKETVCSGEIAFFPEVKDVVEKHKNDPVFWTDALKSKRDEIMKTKKEIKEMKESLMKDVPIWNPKKRRSEQKLQSSISNDRRK